MRSTLFLLAIVAIITACDTATTVENDPATTWQFYQAEFNRADDAVETGATFRKGSATGEIIQLLGGSSVTVNGQSMGYSNSTTATYFRRLTDLVDAGFGLRFDQGGNITTFSNTIAVTDVDTIGLPASITSIDTTEDLDIFWKGAPVGLNEIVTVEFTSAVKGSTSISENEVGETKLVVTKNLWKSIAASDTKWRLVRVRTKIPLQKPTAAGGEMMASWTTGFVDVEFR